MYYRRNSGAAALIASVLAGPIFVLTFALSLYVRQIPDPILLPDLNFQFLSLALIVIIPMVMVGFMVSLFPNLIGAAVMTEFANHHEAAQSPLVWIVAGAAVGTGIAWLGYYQELDPLNFFPPIATSAACAGLCWHFMGWSREPRSHG
ncbi:MAG TPA: hypothetical protein VIT38_08225 [Allosphingosinicella sp.]